MSFKEIKSLLRMVNVDMNDMYAYRLFKVGSHPHSDPSHPHPSSPPALVGGAASACGQASSGPG